MQHPFALTILTFLFTLTGLTGCATPQPTSGHKDRGLAVIDFGLTAGPLRPVERPLASTDLFTLTPRTDARLIINSAGETRHSTRTLQTDGPEGWLLENKDDNSTRLVTDPTGAIRIEWEKSFDDRVRVEYAQPLLMLPSMLAANETYEDATDVRILNLDTDSQRDKGRATVKIRLLGKQRISTVAGEFDVWVVQTTRHLDLQFADAQIEFLTGYRTPGLSQAIYIDRQTKVMGLFGSQHQSLNISAPESSPPPSAAP